MPNLFVKVDINFSLKDRKGNSFLKENYRADGGYNLSITARSESNTNLDIEFQIGNDNSEGGKLTHKLKDSVLEISCQGIFKISVKQAYVSDVLDKKSLWLFNCFGSYEQGLTRLEIKDGLKEEEYEYRRKGETQTGIRYPLDIKTDKAKKNL